MCAPAVALSPQPKLCTCVVAKGLDEGDLAYDTREGQERDQDIARSLGIHFGMLSILTAATRPA